MGTTRYYIDKADPASIESLIDDLNIGATEHKRTVQAVLALHTRPFTLQLRVDYLNPINSRRCTMHSLLKSKRTS